MDNKGFLEKNEKYVQYGLAVAVLILMLYSFFTVGFREGSYSGRAFMECMDKEDFCTPELVENVYLPRERNILRAYPIRVSFVSFDLTLDKNKDNEFYIYYGKKELDPKGDD